MGLAAATSPSLLASDDVEDSLEVDSVASNDFLLSLYSLGGTWLSSEVAALEAERSAKYPVVVFPMQTSPSSEAMVAPAAALNSNWPEEISETEVIRLIPG